MKLKKLASVILAGVMVCAMSMIALAEGSPVKVGATGTDKDGNSVQLVVEVSTQPEPKTDVVKEALGDSYVETMEVIALQEVHVEGDGEIAFPVTVTFSVAGVNKNTKVAVLHWNGSAWENIPATAGEGTVTATFYSLSPVAILVDSATMTQTSTGPNTGATSPNTGESSVVFALGIVALVAACGALGLSKKSA